MMPPANRLDTDAIERLALEVRAILSPRATVTSAVSFAALRDSVTLATSLGGLTARVRPHFSIASDVYAVSEIDGPSEEAWVWLNREAWGEFLRDDVPRTRATLGHELGHVVMHAAEIETLADLDAERDHDERLDLEAWAFSAHLLIPRQAMLRLPRMGAEALARRFGVSVPMAQRRIFEVRGAA